MPFPAADTSFHAIHEPRAPLPTALCLTAFPNPFNSTCRILLEVDEPQIVRVELFDLLGRRVKELWSGALGLDREIAFNGSEPSLGIYFVRATEVVHRRPLATALLVMVK